MLLDGIGCVFQQLRHIVRRGTPRKKIDGKAISEPVRMRIEDLGSTASSLYESLTGKLLDETEMRSLFRVIPEWPLYLAGWAQGMYARALQKQNFSPKKNPGTIDLRFAVHLAHCDLLVTNDYGQYKALRVINALGERRRGRARALSYNQFRRRFVP